MLGKEGQETRQGDTRLDRPAETHPQRQSPEGGGAGRGLAGVGVAGEKERPRERSWEVPGDSSWERLEPLARGTPDPYPIPCPRNSA